MANTRIKQAAIAISMKKAEKKPKSLSKPQNGAIMIGPGYTQPNVVQNHSTPKNRKRLLDRGFDKELSSIYSNLLKKKGIKLDSGFDRQPTYKGKAMKKGGSTPAWTRKEGKNPTGGLNAKGVASYRAANPGSKLQTAVTTKPSKLKAGSKDAKRRKSFCARMSGMPGPMKDEKGRPTRKALSLRKWNC